MNTNNQYLYSAHIKKNSSGKSVKSVKGYMMWQSLNFRAVEHNLTLSECFKTV